MHFWARLLGKGLNEVSLYISGHVGDEKLRRREILALKANCFWARPGQSKHVYACGPATGNPGVYQNSPILKMELSIKR